MNKLSRRLLSGVSLAALGVGLPVAVANAAPGVIINTTVPGYTNPIFPPIDFLSVVSGGNVTGDLINNGFIGSFGRSIALNITGTGIVTGDVINNNVIEANVIGVHLGVLAAADGGFTNNDVIGVQGAGGQVLGVLANNTFGGGIHNNGTIAVSGVGAGTAWGIDVYAIAQGTEVTNIHNAGAIDVKRAGGAFAKAVGIQVTTSANLDLTETNTALGLIKVSATAKGASAHAIASGMRANAFGNAFVNMSNNGVLHVHALAESGGAKATAHAVGVQIGGSIMAAVSGEFVNNSSGVIDVTAVAIKATTAKAQATGIKVTAGSAPNTATPFHVSNFGTVSVSAVATFDSHGQAQAVGIWVDPSGTASIHNHKSINVHAFATGLFTAKATATGLKGTAAGGAADDFLITNDGHVAANATALAFFTAKAHAVGIKAQANSGSLFNHAHVSNLTGGFVKASAAADAFFQAQATATGIVAKANAALGLFATANVDNHGTVSANAFAGFFVGGLSVLTTAKAVAVGLRAEALSAFDDATAGAFNHESGVVSVLAEATGHNAFATARGVEATAKNGFYVSAHAFNSGTVVDSALAFAFNAHAHATGVRASASDAASVYANATNEGDVRVQAVVNGFFANVSAIGVGATAHSGEFVHAFAFNDSNVTVHAVAKAPNVVAGVTAIGVGARAHDATVTFSALAHASVENFGNVKVDASASAEDAAFVVGIGLGANAYDVNALASGHAVAIAHNSAGNVSVTAYAFVSDTVANVRAVGVVAAASGATFAEAHAQNRGAVKVSAFASGNGIAGSAFATGVGALATNALVASAYASNTGNIKVNALVQDSGFANAEAVGVIAHASSAFSAIAHAFNSGTVSVQAHTSAPTGFAVAAGLVAEANKAFFASAHVENSAFVFVQAGGFNSSTSRPDYIPNKATAIGMEAVAGSATFQKVQAINHGEVIARATAVSAHAIGMEVKADYITGYTAVYNSGFVEASADNLFGAATGIKVARNGGGVGGGIGTVVNNGGEVEAFDDGFLANAINVTNAPNAMNIDLEGTFADGRIIGNILLHTKSVEDVVNVEEGETFFDGAINPAGQHVGVLNIGTSSALASEAGTLEMAHDTFSGDAHANVDVYHQYGNGTLELDVTPTQQAASFVYIRANSATLGGTVQLNLAYGLYATGERWRVVKDDISLTPIVGTWSAVKVSFGDDNSNPALFLKAARDNPSVYEADVVLTRAAFNNTTVVPSLLHNNNEFEVATGLENSVAGLGIGSCGSPYACMIQALEDFSGTETQFQAILDQLSGEEYGQLAMADLDAADVLKDAVGTHLQAVMGGPGAMAADVSAPGVAPANGGDWNGVQLWGGGFGQWGKTKDTVAGPGFTENDSGLTGGVDAAVNPETRVGAAFAWTSHGSLNFTGPDSGTYNGFQGGLYARYNEDAYYLQGLASYGSYKNSATRYIFIPLFGAAVEKGNFNSNVWQLYGEGGWHLDAGNDIDVVPYVALDYLNGSNGSFTEHGTFGPILVGSAGATSFSSFLGAKASLLSADVSGMSVVPTVKLAWQHEFDANIWTVNAAFAGVPASAFDLSGQGLSRESLVAGAELAINITDSVDAALSYDGRFSSNRQNNTILGRVNFKF